VCAFGQALQKKCVILCNSQNVGTYDQSTVIFFLSEFSLKEGVGIKPWCIVYIVYILYSAYMVEIIEITCWIA